MEIARRPRMETFEARRLLAFTASGASTLTGSQFQSASEIVALPDGSGYVAAGLFEGNTNFGNGVSIPARGESDVFLTLVRGSSVSTLAIGGESRRELKFNDDRVDFAALPRRVSEEFLFGVSGEPRRADEYVSEMKIGPGGKLYVSLIFRRQVSLNTQNRRAPVLNAVNRFDAEFYDSAILRYDISNGRFALENVLQLGGSFNDLIQDFDFDPSNNLIIAGSFERATDFDAGKGTRLLDPVGRGDAFVAKYSPSGKLQWVSQLGGDSAQQSDIESAYGVDVDASGNIFVGGTFADDADFRSTVVGRTQRAVVRSEELTDGFTAKLDEAGRLSWIRAQGGDGRDGIRDVTLSPGGGVYSVGYFEDEADVDPRANSEQIFNATEDDGDLDATTDLVYNRFDANGNVVWTKQLAGTGFELLASASTDVGGNLVLAGSFYGRADFDPTKRQAILTTPDAGDDVDDDNSRDRDQAYSGFIARYSPNAKLLGATQVNGISGQDVFITGAAVNVNNVYVAGRYRGGLRVPGSTLSLTTRTGDFDDYREDAFSLIFNSNGLKPIV